MFTGLIEATGRVERVEPGTGPGRVLRVATSLAAALTPGESIAVSGVCLTVTSTDGHAFAADLSPETLAVTSLGTAGPGRLVNLERPLAAGGRLGGHFVLGHVDGIGTIAAITPQGGSWWFDVETPAPLALYLIAKGSISIDGISLTIAALAPGRVGLQIVPFTFEHTTLSAAKAGDVVNVEADVLGKYVSRFLQTSLGPSVEIAEVKS